MTDQDTLLDIDFNGDEDFELKTLPASTEVTLRIKSAATKIASTGSKMIALILEDPSDPHVDDIYHNVNLPDARKKIEDPKKFIKALRRVKDFYICFGIATDSPVSIRDLVGCEGRVIVGEEEYEGKVRNKIIKFL